MHRYIETISEYKYTCSHIAVSDTGLKISAETLKSFLPEQNNDMYTQFFFFTTILVWYKMAKM